MPSVITAGIVPSQIKSVETWILPVYTPIDMANMGTKTLKPHAAARAIPRKNGKILSKKGSLNTHLFYKISQGRIFGKFKWGLSY